MWVFYPGSGSAAGPPLPNFTGLWPPTKPHLTQSHFTGWQGCRALGREQQLPLPRTPPEINWSGSGPVQPRSLTRPRQGRGATRLKSAEPQPAHLTSLPCLAPPTCHPPVHWVMPRAPAQNGRECRSENLFLQCPFLLLRAANTQSVGQ